MLNASEADDLVDLDPRFGWERSWKGNFVRYYCGRCLTIFTDGTGTWRWCIAARNGRRRFSNESYTSVDAAINGLIKELE